jgi:GWxTD domain-containing protein
MMKCISRQEQLAVGRMRLRLPLRLPLRLRLPLLLPLLLITGCTTYVPVAGGDNFAYLYGKGAAAIRLRARVYHASESRSIIYFQLRTQDLLYRNAGGGGPFRANVVLKYEAYASIGSTQLLDSASTYVKDTSTDPTEDKELIGSIDMKRNPERSFVLKVTARDVNRDAESSVFITVAAQATGIRESFLPMSERGIPLFGDHVPPGTKLRFRCEQFAGDTLITEYFRATSKLPAPVFAISAEGTPMAELDSTSPVIVGPAGSFEFTAPPNGLVHLVTDTAAQTGYTLFTFDDAFPLVDQSSDMLPPLRYITSLQEWDRLTTAENKRAEIERFWTDAAGSRDRAREAINAFYTRVENANRHFSSWTEGWKTDRGLVSIIFGTPNSIRKNDTGEMWTYGEESNMTSLSFIFEKRKSIFSDNDLVLRRDPVLKSAWYRNVESWRNGRINQN